MTYEVAFDRVLFYLRVFSRCLHEYGDDSYYLDVAMARIDAVADCYLWSNELSEETNKNYYKLVSMSKERFIRRYAKKVKG